MTPPELTHDAESTPGANGTHAAEPDFMARARRILSGDVRPDDYLPVTPEVRRAVDEAMTHYRERGQGQEPAPEVKPRQLLQELLSFHHGGRDICYIQDERGVIVLATDLPRIAEVLRVFGSAWREPLAVTTPEPWY